MVSSIDDEGEIDSTPDDVILCLLLQLPECIACYLSNGVQNILL